MSAVQIVVPAYNAEKYIRECLDSLLAQTHKDWKAIIVDDGSSDGTPVIIQTYVDKDPRFFLHRQKNGGVAAARNKGLDLADSDAEFILFLDNDDFLHPPFIETLLTYYQKYPDALAVYSLSTKIDGAGNITDGELTKRFGYSPKRVGAQGMEPVTEGDPIGFSTMVIWPVIETPGQILFKIAAVKAVGGFDPETVPSDDWYICIRISALGELILVKQMLMTKRRHGANVGLVGKILGVAEPVIRRKLAEDPAFTLEQRRLARRAHFYSCSERLGWAKRSLLSGKVVLAMRQVYQFLSAYAAFKKIKYAGLDASQKLDPAI